MDANDDGNTIKTTPNTLSRSRKCLYRVITTATFNLALLAGISLLASGSFNEQVGYDEGEHTNDRKLHFNLHPLALFGLVIIAYAILGHCLNCTNRLPGKVSHFSLENV